MDIFLLRGGYAIPDKQAAMQQVWCPPGTNEVQTEAKQWIIDAIHLPRELQGLWSKNDIHLFPM